MKMLLDLAARDFRYADFLESLGQRTEAQRIRTEVQDLLRDYFGKW